MSFRFIALSLLLSLAIGCGGGGSGGGGSSSAGNASTGVRVLHAAIETPPLDLFLSGSGTEALRTFHFGEGLGYVRAGEGAQIASVTPANKPATVISNHEITVARGSLFSILAYGVESLGNQGFSVIEDAIPELDATQSALKVVNGAMGAFSLTLLVNAEEKGVATFGSGSEYAILPAGVASVIVRRTVDSKQLYSGAVTLEAGRAYTILVGGEIGDFTKAVLLLDR